MGAWGAGPFENDAALDWAWDLEETGWKAVRDALSAVTVAGSIEADEASCALAAAEVVAASLGNPMTGLPETVSTWVTQHGSDVAADVAHAACDGVVRVATDSELRALWDESGEAEEWRDAVVNVQLRLASAIGEEAAELFRDA